jgi:taurine dioxygenase
MAMIVTALAPFGAQVTGLDLGGMGAPQVELLARLVARARVVVFRHQAIDDMALSCFLRGFGPLMFTRGETPVDAAPDLNVVSNVGRLTPPRSVFHTDTSYVAQPPSLTALRPVVLPARGGPTLFSDQVRAASCLPQRFNQALKGRSMCHQTTDTDGQVQGTRHPLFRRHPITGDVSLYLSTPERCTGLSGMDVPTSRRVVAALYRHSIRPSKLYRHDWQAEDILVWDNRVTMHRADHGQVVGDRVLHRGMVQGEAPLAVD